jgi:hypothetical protein
MRFPLHHLGSRALWHTLAPNHLGGRTLQRALILHQLGGLVLRQGLLLHLPSGRVLWHFVAFNLNYTTTDYDGVAGILLSVSSCFVRRVHFVFGIFFWSTGKMGALWGWYGGEECI